MKCINVAQLPVIYLEVFFCEKKNQIKCIMVSIPKLYSQLYIVCALLVYDVYALCYHTDKRG